MKSNNDKVALAVFPVVLLCFVTMTQMFGKQNASFNSSASALDYKFTMSDEFPVPLSRMIGSAELIVWGRVNAVHDSTFVFMINKQLSGNNKDTLIEVLKVKPDKFANVQPPPYKTGEAFMLFLSHPVTAVKSRVWRVMGVSGEGQMPVENGYIYFQGNNINGLEFENFKVRGEDLYVQRFDFGTFLNAVEGYNKCFRWSLTSDKNKWIPEKICSDCQLGKFGKLSFMHNYLVSQTRLMIH